jgi:hypothetical protein
MLDLTSHVDKRFEIVGSRPVAIEKAVKKPSPLWRNPQEADPACQT